ncbi:glycosyltransferase family 2 protein [Empedobacter falsenii]
MENNILNIIILNWNGWHDTQKCIESILLKTKSLNYNVCLVDNGSNPNEIIEIENYIKKKFITNLSGDKEFFLNKSIIIDNSFLNVKSNQKIIFIKNNENLGFAAGNNIALKILQLNELNNVILLNNDTELFNDALSIMFSHLDDSIGAIIPQIRYFEPNNIIWNCGGMIDTFGIRKYVHAFDNINTLSKDLKIHKVDFGTGCALMFKINKVGILSEKYFFGEEDFEFAFRLRRRKLSIICLYDAIIYHKVGASRNQISENNIGKMVYHYCQRITNLKDNLTYHTWMLSTFLHFLSSVNQLRKMKKMKISTIFNCWKEILQSTTKKQFTLTDFKTISNKKY